MDALIDQVKHLASTADESGRRQLKQALQEAHNSLETTQDILTKMIGLVSRIHFFLRTSTYVSFLKIHSSVRI